MSLAFCQAVPPICADACNGDHLACMRIEYCRIGGDPDCPDADDLCENVPAVCATQCALYAPCFLCEASCSFDGDESCDDGGEGADFSVCPPGSDCDDCGLRVNRPRSPSPSPASPPPPLSLPPSSSPRDADVQWCDLLPRQCSMCLTHVQCLQHLYCFLTPDAPQCATFYNPHACEDAPEMCTVRCALFAHCFFCTDSCNFAGDSDCDDGGSGAEYASCPPNSDCTDCGARGSSVLRWDPSSPALPPGMPPPARPPPARPPFPPPDGSSAAGWIVAVLLIIGAGIGGWCWWRKYRANRPVALLSTRARSDGLTTPYNNAPLRVGAVMPSSMT